MDRKQIQLEFAEFQRSNKLKGAIFPPKFMEWLRMGMWFHAPVSLKMEPEDYIRICKTEKAHMLTLWDLSVVLHVLEVRTANEMGMDLDEYCVYMQYVDNLVKAFRNAVGPKSEELNQKLEAYQKEQQALAAQQQAVEIGADGQIIEPGTQLEVPIAQN